MKQIKVIDEWYLNHLEKELLSTYPHLPEEVVNAIIYKDFDELCRIIEIPETEM